MKAICNLISCLLIFYPFIVGYINPPKTLTIINIMD